MAVHQDHCEPLLLVEDPQRASCSTSSSIPDSRQSICPTPETFPFRFLQIRGKALLHPSAQKARLNYEPCSPRGCAERYSAGAQKDRKTSLGNARGRAGL